MRLAPVILLLALAGCATPAPVVVCPPVREWSLEQQARAADELAALPPAAMLRGMMDDYLYMRDRARACRG